MSKLGPITKGTWTERCDTTRCPATDEYEADHRIVSGKMIICLFDEDEDHQADANLIVDAGNTANRTGKLPSELEAERDELLEAAKAVVKMLDQGQWTTAQYSRLVDLAKAIAKSTGK